MLTEEMRAYYLEKMGIVRYVERGKRHLPVMIVCAESAEGELQPLMNNILNAIDLPLSSCYFVYAQSLSTEALSLLEKEIEAQQPRVIVALGGTPSHAIFGPESAWEPLRGAPHPHPRYGTPVMVTDDVTTLTLQPQQKARAYRDWSLVAAMV